MTTEPTILEQLDSVPLNARVIWDSDGVTRHIPVGNICHSAAQQIRNLTVYEHLSQDLDSRLSDAKRELARLEDLINQREFELSRNNS